MEGDMGAGAQEKREREVCGRTGGGKRDSQGGGKQEKLGENYAKFCN